MSKQIQESDDSLLAQLESKLGYVFRDRTVLRHALTHPSFTVEEFTDNERLEFLGDSVLSLAVNEHLFHSMPESAEGELTRIKSAVVSTTSLARISRAAGLSEFMRLGRGLGNHNALPDSVHANVTEAIFAAVYLDGGLQKASDVILHLLGPEISAVTASAGSENAKSQLQELAQRELGCSPYYHVLSERGPQHGKVFVVAVELRGRRFPEFSGHTKKEAEQGAARLAISALRAPAPAKPAPVRAPAAVAAAEVPAASVPKPQEAPPRKSRRPRRRRSAAKQSPAGKPAPAAAAQPKPAAKEASATSAPPARTVRPTPSAARGRGRTKVTKNPYDTMA